MKKALILFVLIASMAFAVSSEIVHDGSSNASATISNYTTLDKAVIWEVPYDNGNFNTAYALAEANGWSTVDDFYPTGDNYDLETFVLYVLTFNGEGDDPLDVLIYEDSSGAPGNLLETISAPRIFNDTGDTFASYTVWEAVCTLSATYRVDDGVTYWITANPPSGFWYWINSEGTGLGNDCHRSEDGGYSWAPEAGVDMMFNVNGTVAGAVEDTTWGAIKAL